MLEPITYENLLLFKPNTAYLVPLLPGLYPSRLFLIKFIQITAEHVICIITNYTWFIPFTTFICFILFDYFRVVYAQNVALHLCTKHLKSVHAFNSAGSVSKCLIPLQKILLENNLVFAKGILGNHLFRVSYLWVLFKLSPI